MIKLATVISAILGKQDKRDVKVNVMGTGDTQTAIQANPFGVDSNPISDLIAVYAQTGEMGATVLIGYLNKNQIAKIGETRLYSTDESGEEKAYIYLKNDEVIEIGGDADNMVRFTPLDSGLQSFKAAVQAEFVLIAAGIAAAGGTYSPGTLNLDISGAKIDDIKTR